MEGAIAQTQASLARPFLRAATLGIGAGFLSTALSVLTVLAVLHWVPASLHGESAAAHLANMGPGWIFFAAIVFAPLYETVPGQLLPIEFARRLRCRTSACVLISASAFALGHVANGAGLAHGASTFIGGLVFGSCYCRVRQHGWPTSFLAAATAHATHNLLLLYFAVALFPQWA